MRDEKISDGFTHAGNRYQCDERSLAAMRRRAGRSKTWRTADNKTVPMAGNALADLADAASDHVDAIMTRSFALKDAIDASETPEKIDIKIGWPSNERI